MTTSNPSSCSSDEALAALKATGTTEDVNIPNSAAPTLLQSQSQFTALSTTSPERLEASLTETAFDLDKVNAPEDLEKGHPTTVLYLAYGSNLCNETFRGWRKIQPLSALNVLVPSLVLTFDLPGIPYHEPCFANTKYRDHNRDSSKTVPLGAAQSSTAENAATECSEKSLLLPQLDGPNYRKTRWKKPLVGVVYEVTSSDFAHIIATEGGGSGYQDVLVACHPFPPGSSPSDSVPFEPKTPVFKAHTLFAPPPPQRRPDPNYAQASARYLALIKTGVKEHSLPDEYLSYLSDLQPYTMTVQRQRLGGFIFGMMWRPILMAVFALNRVFADKRGRSPEWLRRLQVAVFSGIWVSYDTLFYKIFGDGERTQKEN